MGVEEMSVLVCPECTRFQESVMSSDSVLGTKRCVGCGEWTANEFWIWETVVPLAATMVCEEEVK